MACIESLLFLRTRTLVSDLAWRPLKGDMLKLYLVDRDSESCDTVPGVECVRSWESTVLI